VTDTNHTMQYNGLILKQYDGLFLGLIITPLA
jgi:hypothetical protein